MKLISRIYGHYGSAKQVVHNLEAAGFPHSDIIIVSRKFAEEDTTMCDEIVNYAGIGTVIGGIAGLIAGLGLIAVPVVGSAALTAGWLVALSIGMISGAAIGGIIGSVISSFTSHGISKEDARLCIEASKLGNTIISLRLKNGAEQLSETQAAQIMDVPGALTIDQFRDHMHQQRNTDNTGSYTGKPVHRT